MKLDVCANIPKSVSVSQFANGNFERFNKLLENAAGIIFQNLRTLGLELSAEKSVFIYFNNKGRYTVKPGETSSTINQVIIHSSASTRCLGVTLDHKENFSKQVNEVYFRCWQALNLIIFFRGTWWGADLKTSITLYKSKLRSILEYGSFISFPTQKSFVQKLENIQNSAIRLALRCRSSTTIGVLLAASKLPTIFYPSKFLCHSYLAKISNCHLNYSIFNEIRTKSSNKSININLCPLLFKCICEVAPLLEDILVSENYRLFCNDFRSFLQLILVDIGFGLTLKETPMSWLKIKSWNKRPCRSLLMAVKPTMVSAFLVFALLPVLL